MNILLIITKGEIGGAQVFVSTLAKILHAQGHKVTVACGEGDYLRDTLAPEGISIVRFNSLRRTKNPFTNLFFGWELRTFIAQHSFDVIHFNSSNALFGVIGARLLRHRPKIVFTLHGLSIVDPNFSASKIMKRLYRLLFKFLLSLVDESVFVSKENLEYATRVGLLAKGTVIHNGIAANALRFLSRDEARTSLSALTKTNLSNSFIIGSIGRLAYPKNYEFLIDTLPDILRDIPDAIVLVIGEGPEREKYERMIGLRKLSSSVFFVGELVDAYQYIKAFDLFTLPSEYEGMSITLIEAMFAEVPILASRVGGTPELLDDPKQTYALDDAEDFIAKVKTIHSQKNPLYSETQKTHRAQFEGEAMVRQYEKIYG
ncbi:hypothetical protein A2372_02730 [Candidatus Wolfebacteria bacterium RIFOXYB1_FULL_54_12]|uniref:Glycosyltransferase subfamily 4-like N-terminal domain-containing protein n=1 Tax=Candidatus Wolfebacteria bacterium RIFOXYB1_FULL_54_12 TaxID=1802559 RepID=A0A1F8DZA4_9BACT|nr:MAG: hypothetical protein A2372_02730 [Candidatus Wolfebacteria bacterium RIFOXYB1_FULL_54_12]